ncbi:TonB-dependent receptor [Sphingomonas sp. RIT328]|uniref:TonB-dependent receptor n=1 Tax=Sphingomonas sp. RIT328 TaxID=1470591 RepID=UPI0004483F66|nr:TonB-dependent receptor [Sphingomonas sp. RIT328]EZP56169.1 Cna B-type domain protein [Sphingomonas sp. RIT328]
MLKMSKITRTALRSNAALTALALLGAGIGMVGLAAPAMAQDYTQVNATGRVRGTDGKAIAGAKVEVRSTAQGFTRTAVTDQDGAYVISALPQGTYDFTVSADGYETFTDPAVRLIQGRAANQFNLQPSDAGAASDIVVTAGRVQVVDFSSNTIGQTVDVADVATRVPVARDLTSVVLLAPGTTGGDNRFGSVRDNGLPSVNGSSVSENVYYVNGLNITQFRNGLGAVAIPFEFYQTVQTKTGGISAEFGRFTGGMINATTKSGSNEWHGGITFNWQPNTLISKTKNTFAADNDSAYLKRSDFIAQLSGPIIKDHLFFYGIYDAVDLRWGQGYTGSASATQTGPAGCASNPTMCADYADLRKAGQQLVGTSYSRNANTSPFWGGKVDAVIVDGQRLEATYWNTSGKQIEEIYGTSQYTLASGQRYNPNTNAPDGYVTSNVYRAGGENYVFRYTGSFTNWLTLSAAYGVNKNSETTESGAPDLPYVLDQRNGANSSIGNTVSNASLNFDKRTFYRADADLRFSLLGSHHIRGGYDREDLDETSTTIANGGAQYTLLTASGDATTIDPTVGLPGGTPYAVARAFKTGGQFATRNTAFYAQDEWRLFQERINLNFGVRNDRFENRNAAGQTFFLAKNQWSPRLGGSIDPLGDGRTKFFGSFSRYYLPVAVNTNVRLAGSELDYNAYYVLNGLSATNVPILGAPITTGAGFTACPGNSPAGTACVVSHDGTVPSTASVVAANLKPQSVDEIVFGIERRLGHRIRLAFNFTQAKLNNSLEDASLDQAIVPYCIAQGKAASDCRSIWSGVEQFALINPGRDVVVTLSDPLPGETSARTVTLSSAALQYPLAQRTYRGVTFALDRESDGKWELHANYTYSKLVGNIEGGVRSNNGQSDSGLTTAFDLPALVDGTYGYLPNDRRHNLKVWGSYKFADWLTLGVNANVMSPRKFGCYGRAPASRDFDATAPGGITGLYYKTSGAYCDVANGKVVRDPTGFTVINDRFDRVGGVRPTTLGLVPRGSQLTAAWLAQVNLDATVALPTDAFNGFLRLSVFNVFNAQPALRLSETGTTSAGAPLPTYSLPVQYNLGRAARIQLGVAF